MKMRTIALVAVAAGFLSVTAWADIGQVGPGDPQPQPAELPARPKKIPFVEPRGAGPNQYVPVTGANAPGTAPQGDAQAAPEESSRVSLLAIDFTKRNVYYDRQLRAAIRGAESTRQGVHYVVISTVPAQGAGDRSEIRRHNEGFGSQMDNVLATMTELGVSGNNIESRTVASDTATSQQIEIFTK